jgi:hypothetical protein
MRPPMPCGAGAGKSSRWKSVVPVGTVLTPPQWIGRRESVGEAGFEPSEQDQPKAARLLIFLSKGLNPGPFSHPAPFARSRLNSPPPPAIPRRPWRDYGDGPTMAPPTYLLFDNSAVVAGNASCGCSPRSGVGCGAVDSTRCVAAIRR